MTELVDVSVIAKILPYTTRQITDFAKKGIIPSAIKLTKDGKWLFDEIRVRQWLRNKEEETCQEKSQISTKGVNIIMPKLKDLGRNSTELLEKRLFQRPVSSETESLRG